MEAIGSCRVDKPFANHSVDLQEARKQLAVVQLAQARYRQSSSNNIFGYLEYRVLEYASRVAEMFTVSEVVSYFYPNIEKTERIRLLKRFHDAVNRLVSRGIITKVARGVYRLVKDIDLSILKLKKESKETHSHIAVFVDGGVSRSMCVVRFHVSGRSVYDFVRSVVFARAVVDSVYSWVVGNLVSRSVLRRLERSVSFAVRDVRFGVHGVYGYRFFSEPKRFVAVDRLFFGSAREIGVDMYVDGVDKFFIKIYTTSDTDASSRPLIPLKL